MYSLLNMKFSKGIGSRLKRQTLVILSRGVLSAFLKPHKEMLLRHDAICADAFIDRAAIYFNV
jgi:hypothetical protein